MHLADVPAKCGKSGSSEQTMSTLYDVLDLVRRSEHAVVSREKLGHKRAVCAAEGA